LEDLEDRDGLHLDWYNLIPLFEFAYNSSVHATTKQIPFEVDLGRIPNNPLTSIGNSLPGLLGVNRAASSYANHLKMVQERAAKAIKMAHEASKKRWDSKHQESPFEPGDFIGISSKFFFFVDRAPKLKPTFVGPFEMREKVGPNACRLKLHPPFHRRHPVFPVSLLKKAAASPPQFEGRRTYPHLTPRSTLAGDKVTEEEVTFILRERLARSFEDGKPKREFLIRWKGFDSDSDTWVPEKDLKVPVALRAYHSDRRHPSSGAEPEPTLEAEAEDEGDVFEVDFIIKERAAKRGAMEYLIRWVNYGPSDDSWQSPESLKDAPEVLEAWEATKAAKRKPAHSVRTLRSF
jgi:hypothetical protein